MKAPLYVLVLSLAGACAATGLADLSALEGRWSAGDRACTQDGAEALSIAGDEIAVGGESCFIKEIAEQGAGLVAIGVCAVPDAGETVTREFRLSRLGDRTLLVRRDGGRGEVYRACGPAARR